MFVNFNMHRIILSILLTGILFAKEKVFVHEYTYQVIEGDSKTTSRANGLENIIITGHVKLRLILKIFQKK